MTDIAFTQNGFKDWNKALERFRTHIGEVNSIYNKCFNIMINLMNQSQSIRISFEKHFEKQKNKSWRCLNASIDVARFLSRLGLSFYVHDESVSSTNRAIVDACAKETIKVTMEDLNGDYFEILVDESKDISHKEQMTLVLRYVDEKGEVIERFDGFVHLQLTLVALVKKNSDVDDFFCLFINVLNIVRASYKRRYLLRQHQAAKLEKLIISGEVHTGRGLNQECGLQRPCETCWGSHCKTLEKFIDIFSSILYMLGFIARECPNYLDRLTTETLKNTIKGFDFAFMLHLMLKVLMITNYLNSSLQKMDQDIINAMELLNTAKQGLQRIRDSGWSSLLDDVFSFCDKYEIAIPKMDARYIPGKSKHRALDVTYYHYFWVKRYFVVIDLLL
ncbi:uncharacterized protein LOC124889595 [Capsicum annuum]|uniref:uncharacterized protein LOC124889595 n=1 Tax=Capsicum annuum TaxID=4072 RepID=UPI001FB09F81|nr:uncharacterized protein LOC124889595 [Capsicum annuum]